MSKTYFISDLHLGHANIIKYCNRPFKDVEEMTNKIINNWNAIVQPDDLVYHLGDFCLGGKEKITNYTARLSGRKFAILGNHDKYRPSEYMEMGWEWCSRFPIIFNGFMILSHEPVFLEANSPYGNLHGHIHQHKYEGIHHFNCSVEHHNYTPVLMSVIEDHYRNIGHKSE